MTSPLETITLSYQSLRALLVDAFHTGQAHALQQDYRTGDPTIDHMLQRARIDALIALDTVHRAALRKAQQQQRTSALSCLFFRDGLAQNQTAILPLFGDGEYLVQDNVFSYDRLYEVVHGIQPGLRGTWHELEAYCGALHLADPWSAIDAHTGVVLVVEQQGYGSWRVKEG
jgi:hypothetical protein